MNIRSIGLLVLASLATPSIAATAALAPELSVFQSLINTTWQGNVAESGKAVKVDVSKWERVLNGQAIRITHSIAQGEYGGETMLLWDKNKQSLVYFYFTTAGFYTHGTMTFVADKQQFIAQEDVVNNASGITKVRSITTLKADSLTVNSEYLKNGVWQPGHSAVYRPAVDVQPEFR